MGPEELTAGAGDAVDAQDGVVGEAALDDQIGHLVAVEVGRDGVGERRPVEAIAPQRLAVSIERR